MPGIKVNKFRARGSQCGKSAAALGMGAGEVGVLQQVTNQRSFVLLARLLTILDHVMSKHGLDLNQS